jgi:hypothetical protein
MVQAKTRPRAKDERMVDGEVFKDGATIKR